MVFENVFGMFVDQSVVDGKIRFRYLFDFGEGRDPFFGDILARIERAPRPFVELRRDVEVVLVFVVVLEPDSGEIVCFRFILVGVPGVVERDHAHREREADGQAEQRRANRQHRADRAGVG